MCLALWGESVSDKGTSKCKGPELELCLVLGNGIHIVKELHSLLCVE